MKAIKERLFNLSIEAEAYDLMLFKLVNEISKLSDGDPKYNLNILKYEATIRKIEHIIPEIKDLENALRICKIVLNYFKLTPQQLVSKTNKWDISHPRYILFHFLKLHCNFTYTFLAETFQKHTSTVQVGCRKIERFLEGRDRYITMCINDLTPLINLDCNNAIKDKPVKKRIKELAA